MGERACGGAVFICVVEVLRAGQGRSIVYKVRGECGESVGKDLTRSDSIDAVEGSQRSLGSAADGSHQTTQTATGRADDG